VLGLGINNHIESDQPPDTPQPRVHAAILSESSLKDVVLQQPAYRLALSMAEPLQSRHVPMYSTSISAQHYLAVVAVAELV